MNKLLLNLIVICHTIYVLFVVLTPFIGNNYFLLLHAMVVPFMMLHWVLNNNTCALSMMEKTVREQIYGTVKSDDCFTCNLINPIYDFKNNYDSLSNFIYLITTILWFITLYKLIKKYTNGEITNIYDIVKF